MVVVRACLLLACALSLSAPSLADIQGKAQWDPDSVQRYFKHSKKLDISAGPGSYPNRDMLSKVNAEFAKRVDVLVALYHAGGGAQPIGIVSRTGALREAQSQQDLYKQCRRPPPGGDANTDVSHWVYDKRKPGTGPPANWPSSDPDKGVFVKSDTCPNGAPVTWETVSWHNVGLAVDFGQYKTCMAKKTKKNPNPTPTACYDNGDTFLHQAGWDRVLDGMEGLGLISGGSFGDPAHLDWHPSLLKPEQAGASGTAATNVNPGYAWHFPDAIYVYRPGQARGSTLDVYQFGSATDDLNRTWLTVRSKRQIVTFSNGDWAGTWVTYDPPVHLFPAYIPTVNLASYEPRYRAASSVTVKTYSLADGGKAEVWREEDGGLDYYPEFEIDDLQKIANLLIGRSRMIASPTCAAKMAVLLMYFPGQCGTAVYLNAITPYRITNLHSYYNVKTSTTPVGAGPPVTRRWREVHRRPDNTTNTIVGDNQNATWQLGGISLWDSCGCFGWNRETGDVGQWLSVPAKGATQQLQSTAGGETISRQLPAGAVDKTGPPSWPL